MEFDNYINYDHDIGIFLQKLSKIQQDCLNKTLLKIAWYIYRNSQEKDIYETSKLASEYIMSNNIFDISNKKGVYLYCDIMRYFYIIKNNF